MRRIRFGAIVCFGVFLSICEARAALNCPSANQETEYGDNPVFPADITHTLGTPYENRIEIHVEGLYYIDKYTGLSVTHSEETVAESAWSSCGQGAQVMSIESGPSYSSGAGVTFGMLGFSLSYTPASISYAAGPVADAPADQKVKAGISEVHANVDYSGTRIMYDVDDWPLSTESIPGDDYVATGPFYYTVYKCCVEGV